jgi:predicted transcriptional regulator
MHIQPQTSAVQPPAQPIGKLLSAPPIDFAVSIVASYVSHNPVSQNDLPKLIQDVHGAIYGLMFPSADAPAAELVPAVPLRKSVTPDWVICLEDGKKFKSLKRHLLTQYNLTPAQYREKWGLPVDYPMVAPNYSIKRSQLAKDNGLGKKS